MARDVAAAAVTYNALRPAAERLVAAFSSPDPAIAQPPA
jgi:hypothetical protein